MKQEDKDLILAMKDAVEDAVATAKAVSDLYAHYIGLTDEFEHINAESIERGYNTLAAIAERSAA